MAGVLTVYYIPVGGVSHPHSSPWWPGPHSVGHVFIEVSDSTTDVHKYFDFSSVGPNESPRPIGPGYVNPSLDNAERSDAYSITIPLNAEQEQRVADAIDRRVLSPGSYSVPNPLGTNDCVTGVTAILGVAGIDIKSPKTPTGVWDKLMQLRNDNSPLLDGSEVRDNQSLPGNNVDANFCNDGQQTPDPHRIG